MIDTNNQLIESLFTLVVDPCNFVCYPKRYNIINIASQRLLATLNTYFPEKKELIARLAQYYKWRNKLDTERSDHCTQEVLLDIVKTVKGLEEGEGVLIPGGYAPHEYSMFYELTKIKKGDTLASTLFQLRVGDRGTGLIHCMTITNITKTRYQLTSTFKNIPAEKLLYGTDETGWFNLLLYFVCHEDTAVTDKLHLLYNGILRPLTPYQSLENPNTPQELWGSAPWLRHNHSAHIDFAWYIDITYIRLCLSKDEYQKFRIHIKIDVTNTYYHSLTHPFQQKEQFLLNMGMQAISHNILKTHDTNQYRKDISSLQTQITPSIKPHSPFISLSCKQISDEDFTSYPLNITALQNIQYVYISPSSTQDLKYSLLRWEGATTITGKTFADAATKLMEALHYLLKSSPHLPTGKGIQIGRYLAAFYLIEQFSDLLSIKEDDWQENGSKNFDIIIKLFKKYFKLFLNHMQHASTRLVSTPHQAKIALTLYFVSTHIWRNLPADQMFEKGVLTQDHAEEIRKRVSKWWSSPLFLSKIQEDSWFIVYEEPLCKSLQTLQQSYQIPPLKIDFFSPEICNETPFTFSEASSFYGDIIRSCDRAILNKIFQGVDTLSLPFFYRIYPGFLKKLLLSASAAPWRDLSHRFHDFRHLILYMQCMLLGGEVNVFDRWDNKIKINVLNLESNYLRHPIFSNQYPHYNPDFFHISDLNLQSRSRLSKWQEVLRGEELPLEVDRTAHPLKKDEKQFMRRFSSLTTEPSLLCVHTLSFFQDHLYYLKKPSYQLLFISQFLRADEKFNILLKQEIQDNPALISQTIMFVRSVEAISLTDKDNLDIETALFAFFISQQLYSIIASTQPHQNEERKQLIENGWQELRGELDRQYKQMNEWIHEYQPKQSEHISAIHLHRLNYHLVIFESTPPPPEAYPEIFGSYFVICMVQAKKYFFLQEKIYPFVLALLPLNLDQLTLTTLVQTIVQLIGVPFSPQASISQDGDIIKWHTTEDHVFCSLFTGEILYNEKLWNPEGPELLSFQQAYQELFGEASYFVSGTEDSSYLKHPGGQFRFTKNLETQKYDIDFSPHTETQEYWYRFVPAKIFLLMQPNLPIHFLSNHTYFENNGEWVFVKDRDYASFAEAMRYKNGVLISPKNGGAYYTHVWCEEFSRVERDLRSIQYQTSPDKQSLIFTHYDDLVFEKHKNGWWMWQGDPTFALMTNRNIEPLAISNTLILENNQHNKLCVVPCLPIACNDNYLDAPMCLNFSFHNQGNTPCCFYNLSTETGKIVLIPRTQLAMLWLAYYQLCQSKYTHAFKSLKSIALADFLTPQSEKVLAWIYGQSTFRNFNRPLALPGPQTPSALAIALHAILIMIQKEEQKNPYFTLSSINHANDYVKQIYCQYLSLQQRGLSPNLRLSNQEESKLYLSLSSPSSNDSPSLNDIQILQHFQYLNEPVISRNPPIQEENSLPSTITLNWLNITTSQAISKALQRSTCEHVPSFHSISQAPMQCFNNSHFILFYEAIVNSSYAYQEIETLLWIKLASPSNSNTHLQLLGLLFLVLQARRQDVALPQIPTDTKALEKWIHFIQEVTTILQNISYNIPSPPFYKNVMNTIQQKLQNVNMLKQAISTLLPGIQSLNPTTSTSPPHVDKTPFPESEYADQRTLLEKMNLTLFPMSSFSPSKQPSLYVPAFVDKHANERKCILQAYAFLNEAIRGAQTHIDQNKCIADAAHNWIQNNCEGLECIRTGVKEFLENREKQVKTYKKETVCQANQLPEEDLNTLLLKWQGSKDKLTIEHLEHAVLHNKMEILIENNPRLQQHQHLTQLITSLQRYEIADIEATQARQALNCIENITKTEDPKKKIFYVTKLYAICNQPLSHLKQCNLFTFLKMLIITHRFKIVPKQHQLENIKDLCDFLNVKAMMGDGKSKVYTPFWAFYIAKKEGKLPVILMKEALYSSFFDSFKQSQKIVFCGQDVFTINLTFTNLNDEAFVNQALQMLNEGIEKNRVLVMRPETLQMINLYLENQLTSHSVAQSFPKPLLTLHTLFKTLCDQGEGLLDEAHDILDSKHYVVIPSGSPESVPLNEAALIREVMEYLLEDSLNTLVGLGENRQGMLNTQQWRQVRQGLATKFLDTHPLLLPQELRASFFTFITNELGEPIPSNLRDYVTKLASSTSSLEEQNKAEIIALFSILLFRDLPFAFRYTPGLHFGRAFHSPEVVPFDGANTPSKNKQIGYYIEALIKTIMTGIQQGITPSHIFALQKKYSLLAKQEMHMQSLDIQTTQGFKKFQDLTGISLFDVKHTESLQKAIIHINEDRSKQLDIEMEVAILHIKIYPQSRCSSSQAIPCLLSRNCGMSGTPYNRLDYNYRIGETFKFNEQVEGIVIHTLLTRENTTQFYKLNGSLVTSLLQQATANGQNMPVAIIDLGALLKDKSNAEHAQEYLKIAQEHGKRAVIFFHHFEEELTNHCLAVGIIKNDRFVIERLSGSHPEDFQKKGLLPDECVFLYDNPHTLGTDLPLVENARGIVTFNLQTEQTRLFQAIKRMRQFETTQTVDFACLEVCAAHLFKNGSSSVRDLLDLTIINQAINQARSFFESKKQEIEEEIKNSYRNQIKKNPKISHSIHLIYSPITLTTTKRKFFQQVFGDVVYHDPMQVLENYASKCYHHLKHAFDVHKHALPQEVIQSFTEEFQSIKTNINNIISRAKMYECNLMQKVLFHVNQESGYEMGKEVQIEIATERAEEQEQEQEQEQDLTQEYHQELMKYQQLMQKPSFSHCPWWEGDNRDDILRKFIQHAQTRQSHPSNFVSLQQIFEYYSHKHPHGRRRFNKIFSPDILATQMFYQNTKSWGLVFHKYHKVGDQILIIKSSSSHSFTFVLLSQVEAGVFKTWLAQTSTPNVWLCNGSGQLFVQSRTILDLNDPPICRGLVEINIFLGKGKAILSLGDLGCWNFLQWLEDNENGSQQDRKAYITLCSINQTNNNKLTFLHTYILKTSSVIQDIKGCDVQKIKNINIIRQFVSDQAPLVSAWQVPYLRSNCFSLLKTPEQINSVPNDKLTHLISDQYPLLDAVRICYFFDNLPQKNVQTFLTPSQIPHVNNKHVSCIDTKHVEYLMDNQILHISESQLPHVPQDKLKYVNPAMYPHFTVDQACKLFNDLDANAIQNLPEAIISLLDRDQIQLGKLKYLKDKQMPWISFPIPCAQISPFKEEKYKKIFQHCVQPQDTRISESHQYKYLTPYLQWRRNPQYQIQNLPFKREHIDHLSATQNAHLQKQHVSDVKYWKVIRMDKKHLPYILSMQKIVYVFSRIILFIAIMWIANQIRLIVTSIFVTMDKR